MDDEAVVSGCRRCSELVEERTQIVNGDGALDAPAVFVGEAPGRYEDERGVPFVGRSGKLLDEALAERGLGREEVRITNCVRCRPPENRNPRAGERANCRSYLDAELAIVDPEVILTLGRIPASELLNRQVSVTNEAGSTADIKIDGTSYRVVIGLHPAATLYDRSKTATFEAALDRALEMAGLLP